MKPIAITEIMTKKPLSVHPKEEISFAVQLMKQNAIHHLPITVGQKVVGIVSMGDLLFLQNCVNQNKDMFLKGTNFQLSALDEIMTKNPICLTNNSFIQDAVLEMQESRINCLPIVDENKNLVGIVTTHDLIQFLGNLYN